MEERIKRFRGTWVDIYTKAGQHFRNCRIVSVVDGIIYFICRSNSCHFFVDDIEGISHSPIRILDQDSYEFYESKGCITVTPKIGDNNAV